MTSPVPSLPLDDVFGDRLPDGRVGARVGLTARQSEGVWQPRPVSTKTQRAGATPPWALSWPRTRRPGRGIT